MLGAQRREISLSLREGILQAVTLELIPMLLTGEAFVKKKKSFLKQRIVFIFFKRLFAVIYQ